MPTDRTQTKKPRTEKQRQASRTNGARSCGVASSQIDKERYSRLAQVLLLPGESRKIFMTLADEFVQSLSPQTPVQHLLIGKMLAAHWRQNRLWGAGNPITPTSLADENRLDRQFYRAYDRYFRRNKNCDPQNNPSGSFPDTYPPSGTPAEPEITRETQETRKPEPEKPVHTVSHSVALSDSIPTGSSILAAVAMGADPACSGFFTGVQGRNLSALDHEARICRTSGMARRRVYYL